MECDNENAWHIVPPVFTITKDTKHIASGMCYCKPELIYENPNNGWELWRHVREV